jgi:acetolactate synthase small subunit
MIDPGFQLLECDWLMIGSRGNREGQLRAINLCRRFDGTVLFREGEVMVIEVSGYPQEIDDLLAKLPREGITHLWRSGQTVQVPGTVVPFDSKFCGMER